MRFRIFADFDPERDLLPDEKLWEIDAWMLRRTGELVRDCRAWYESFDFHRVFHAIHDFAVVDLSAFYFDVLKDRSVHVCAAKRRTALGADGALSHRERAAAADRADFDVHI